MFGRNFQFRKKELIELHSNFPFSSLQLIIDFEHINLMKQRINELGGVINKFEKL